MKNLPLVFLLTLSGFQARSQYYYKDIIGSRESSELIRLYKTNKIRSVVLKSIGPDDMYIDGLSAGQSISADFRKMITLTRSERTDPSFITSYYDESGTLLKTVDSVENLTKTAIYTYKPKGRLSSIVYLVRDSAEENKAEEHQWIYNEAGHPVRMLRINDKDTTFTQFTLDESGNVTEEKTTRNGFALGEPYYYYYDDRNRLSDIVRYNRRADKLLPDYMFEYSEKDQVLQMITVPNNSSAYLIWRYQYDTNGLKTKEACFGKNKELLGKIEYHYTMGY